MHYWDYYGVFHSYLQMVIAQQCDRQTDFFFSLKKRCKVLNEPTQEISLKTNLWNIIHVWLSKPGSGPSREAMKGLLMFFKKFNFSAIVMIEITTHERGDKDLYL